MECFAKNVEQCPEVNKEIVNIPWAKNLLEAASALTVKSVIQWCISVKKIGESEVNINEYTAIFLQHLEDLYESMISDVDGIYDNMLDRVEELLSKVEMLSNELQTEKPNFHLHEMPLGQLQIIVKEKVEELENLADIRRKELFELKNKQRSICKRLGREPLVLADCPLPSSTEMDVLRQFVEKLENEALEREEKYFQLKEEIVEIVKDLEVAPNLDFERDILDLTNTQVRISDTEMEELVLFHEKMCKKRQIMKKEIEELRTKIDDLWNKLEVDMMERCEFREKNKGNSLKVLDALKKELFKLDEAKKANIRSFILKQREELVELWEKCQCGQEERNEFSFMDSECFNEDLFELHDREIAKWKKYYEDNQEIFNVLQEFQQLWKDHLELERNSGGSNRYKNRGGQLLQEEKLRNKFKKRIPQCEEKLRNLAQIYFAKKQRHFLIFGQTMESYLHGLHEAADTEFKLKLSAKKQEREQASCVGRSRMNLFPPSSAQKVPLTPRSTSKRKLATPCTEPTKKQKTAGKNQSKTTGLPKVRTSLTKRRSDRREKARQRLSFKKKNGSGKENQNETMSTSYEEFEKNVATKEACRSTEFGFVFKVNDEIVEQLPKIEAAGPATPGIEVLEMKSDRLLKK